MEYNQFFAILMLIVGLYAVAKLWAIGDHLLAFWLLIQVLYWALVKFTGHL